MYTYKIYHEYEIGDQSVTFKTDIPPTTLKELLAVLEFFYEEYVDDSDSVCGRAATETINKLFAPIEYVEGVKYPNKINTYINREQYCGDAYKLMEKYDQEGLVKILKAEQEKETARLMREIPELQY